MYTHRNTILLFIFIFFSFFFFFNQSVRKTVCKITSIKCVFNTSYAYKPRTHIAVGIEIKRLTYRDLRKADNFFCSNVYTTYPHVLFNCV